MKTIKFLLITGLLFIVCFATTKAGENEVRTQAYQQLNYQINQTMKNFPFEEISRYDNSGLMMLTFTVNDKHEMKNIEVLGNDPNLAQYVKKILEDQDLKVNSYFDGKTCRVPLRFVNARY